MFFATFQLFAYRTKLLRSDKAQGLMLNSKFLINP